MNKTKTFKKVSAIRTFIQDKVSNYKTENNMEGYDFSAEFTIKKAELAIIAPIKHYSANIGKIHTYIYKSSSNELLISVNIEKTDYWHKSIGISEMHLENILAIQCSYWQEYASFKGVQRVLFLWSEYRGQFSSNVFYGAMDRLGYRSLFYPKTILGLLNDEVCRSTEKEGLLNTAEFLAEEIEDAQKKCPSFVVERKNHEDFMPIFSQTYFYENQLFQLRYDETDNQLELVRSGMENRQFEIKEGVIEDILQVIQEDMKLVNLLNPPIKQISNVVEKLKIDISKELLEEKVARSDENIGLGKTEDEMGFIAGLLEKHTLAQYQTNNKRDLKKEFQLNEEDSQHFTDLYKNEFYLYRFQTNHYCWHIMYSFNEKDIWLYASPNKEVPVNMKEDAEKVFEQRRNLQAMKDIQDAINLLKSVQAATPLTVATHRFDAGIDALVSAAEREFGVKWKEYIE